MPTFQYEAMNQAGQEVKDEIDALLDALDKWTYEDDTS